MATEKKLQNEKLEKWREVINKMDLKELLKLKFCNDDSKKWQLMYTPYSSGGKSFYCMICKMVLIDQNSVKSHSGYNKHNKSLEKVFDLFHESKNPFEEKTDTKNEMKSDNISNTTNKSANTNNNSNCGNDKGSTERSLSLSKEFKDKMTSLNMTEFLEVEYLMKDKWEKLFIAVKGGHSCTICKSNLLTSLSGLKNHISNRQHKANIDLVKILYHPKHLNFTKGSSNDIVDLANLNEKGDESDDDDFLGKHIIKNLINMTVSELLRVEFKQEHSSPWKVLFQSLNSRNDQFKCVVCNSPNLKSLNELNNHLKNENHLNKLKSVHALFHSNTASNIISQKVSEPKKQIEKEKTSSTSVSSSSEKKSITSTTAPSETKSTASTTTSALNASDKKSTTSTNVAAPIAPAGTKYKSVADFASDMISMKVNDILKVEYMSSFNIWRKLIPIEDDFYTCDICYVKKLKDIPLMDHLKGKRHKDSIRLKVTRFHHPVLLPTKTEKEVNKSQSNTQSKQTTANSSSISNTTKKATNENLVKIVPQAKITAQNNASKIGDGKEEIEIVTVEDSPERELFQSKANDKTTSSNDKPVNKPSESNKQTFEKKEFSTNLNEELDGFVGVEYVIKLIKHATDNDPRFECCLCEIELNANGMQFHLKGVAHRTKYLERHFSTCMKQFKDFRGDYKVMHQVTDKICKAIEKYHGRDLPMELVLNDFKSNRRSYVEKVFSYRHASEMSGPSFTNVVDKNELNNIKNNKNFKIPERNNDSKVTFTVRDNKRKTNYPYIQDTSSKPTETEIRGQEIPKTQSNRNNFNKVSSRAPFREEKDGSNYSSNYNPMYGQMGQNNVIPYGGQPVVPGYQDPYNTPYYADQTRNDYSQQQTTPVLDNEEHRRLAEKFIKQNKVNDRSDRYHKRSRSPRRHSHSHRRSSRTRSRSRSKKDDRQRRDHNRRSLSKSPLRENDVWQAYRRKFDMDIKIVDMDFQQYYKDPTAYPTYNEEWQNFWANRMNEIKQGNYLQNKIKI